MDQNDPNRRSYASRPYAPSHPGFAHPSQQSSPAQYATPISAGRVRSGFEQTPSSSVQHQARPGADGQHVYGFTPGGHYDTTTGMQPTTLQYPTEMQTTPDTHRQSTQQTYPSYAGNVMSAMTQSQASQPTASPYDPVAQYRQRVGGSETMANTFGVPPQAQYYMAGPSGAAELAAPQMASQYDHADYAPGGPSTASAYPGAIIDPTQAGAYAQYTAHQYGSQQQQQQQQAQQQQAAPIDTAAFERYRAQLRNVFTLARDGALRETQNILLDATNYLVGNAEALGFTRDDDTQHDFRIGIWDEFNRAWLVTLQRQYDMTEEMISAGRQLQEPQSLLTAADLDHLARELLRSGDGVERHGLVDYQMGIAEDEIIDLLLRCQRLLESGNAGATGAEPAATGAG